MKLYNTLFVLVVFNFLDSFIIAQVPNIEFQKTFGGTDYDEATSIIGLPNGKSLVAGYTYSSISSMICPSSSNFWIFQFKSKKIYP